MSTDFETSKRETVCREPELFQTVKQASKQLINQVNNPKL